MTFVLSLASVAFFSYAGGAYVAGNATRDLGSSSGTVALISGIASAAFLFGGALL